MSSYTSHHLTETSGRENRGEKTGGGTFGSCTRRRPVDSDSAGKMLNPDLILTDIMWKHVLYKIVVNVLGEKKCLCV